MIKEQLSSGRMRMIGWMDVGVVVMHNMLFRGRSEDKEEEHESVFQEEEEKEKKKVIYVLNFIFIAEAL